ncbi:hypothetical protein [Mucilaginibacter agri]|uniref:Uncharacterized protein n=1 Tax=Mucilaginibacter agri TaxID=2695265 RepID=A0A965ZFA3_9SPHI|nr:hypothetical protein [Mucilaginibacter agri]NCD69994.1 hypothetical protein [Mucilaginibacter agri]
MANFIELLDKNDRNTLVNVDNITSIVIYKDPEEEVRIYLIGDQESYITVKESYEELKQKLQDWTKINLR